MSCYRYDLSLRCITTCLLPVGTSLLCLELVLRMNSAHLFKTPYSSSINHPTASHPTSQQPHFPNVSSTSPAYRLPIPLPSHLIIKNEDLTLYATSHRSRPPCRRTFFPSPTHRLFILFIFLHFKSPVYLWLIVVRYIYRSQRKVHDGYHE